MEGEEGKQSPPKTPLHTQLDQVNSDLVLAIGMQEQQGGTFTNFATFESGSESESSFDNDDNDDDADFFLSQEDLQFLESEGSNYYYDDDDEEEEEEDDDEGMEEDEIDVDELTYEELIELGDFIGQEKRGLSSNEICSCLHSYTFRCAQNNSEIDRCVICQVEYEEGEALVAVQCEHPYHRDCISKWLQIKKVCPICNSEISVPKIVN